MKSLAEVSVNLPVADVALCIKGMCLHGIHKNGRLKPRKYIDSIGEIKEE